MKKLIFVLSILYAYSVQSATLTVTNTSNTGTGSLRAAIAAAATNDIIVFSSALANQTITLAATLEIPVGKNLTIDGLAAANLTISGNNAVRIFLLKSTSVQPTTLNLKNLKIINGRTIEYGGGIKSEHQGIMNFENCIFNNNVADDGGSAIFSSFEGRTTVKNCKFDGNVSVADNTERGSTVMLWGPFAQVIQNSDFTNNRGINGAAINGLNAALLIEDCNFLNNSTTDAFFDTGQPNDFLRGFGGAIYADRATPATPTSLLGSIIIRRSKFDGNRGEGEGGACYLYTDETDDVLIENCSFNDNTSMALTGGGAEGGGGAIQHMNNAKNRGFIVRNTTFSNNRAGVLGGAIRADWADTEITNCTFFNNRGELTNGTGYAANGGAVTFFSMSNSTVNITNSTFANNYAGWVGGAISTSDPANTRIKNNIFLNNTAGNGGNNWNIQQHSSAELTDLGNNLQFPNKFTGNGNDYNVSATVTIANPLLSSLANNGGPTQTMALQTGSPAINTGSGCPTFDQRGAARVGNCDIGAFEFGGIIVTPCPSISVLSGAGLNGTTYKASVGIESTQVINVSTTVTYQTGVYTLLKPGFETKSGAVFKTQYGGCL